MRTPRAQRRRSPRRPKPLPTASVIYDDADSRVPDAIRVSFDDGTTAVYERKTSDVAPLVIRNIEIIHKWLGYTPPSLRTEETT